ncbi:hypothetical protein V6N13_069382 [Hibiscus sabdariffa]
MITLKKLIRVRRKWQKIASIGRKRNALTRTNKDMAAAAAADRSNKSSVVDKGCFAIYTIDKRRFAIPLAFLGNCIFRELLKMSEEEFGLPSDGPITLPCDSVLMNYIVSLVKRGLAKEMERAVLNSITTYRCSPDTCFSQGHADQQTTSSIIASAKAEFQAKPPPAMEYLPLLTVHIPSFEFISDNLPTFFMTTEKQNKKGQHSKDFMFLYKYKTDFFPSAITYHYNTSNMKWTGPVDACVRAGWALALFLKKVSMVSTKKLIEIARKWEKITAFGRRRITSSRSSTDRKTPLADRSNKQSELFKMSEEEFRLSSDGPITLPGNSVIMSYIVLLVQRGLDEDLEKAKLSSIIGHGCSLYTTIFHGHAEKQSLVCGF